LTDSGNQLYYAAFIHLYFAASIHTPGIKKHFRQSIERVPPEGILAKLRRLVLCVKLTEDENKYWQKQPLDGSAGKNGTTSPRERNPEQFSGFLEYPQKRIHEPPRSKGVDSTWSRFDTGHR